MATVKRYRGSTRRLIISFDVGTTFSGVSYCFLEPGEEPKILSVTRFPGQEHAAGAPKVPSVLYYDKEGNMRAAGAEVNSAENIEKSEDEEWIRIEWFKLRMRPKSMPTKLRTSNLPPLPPNKTLLQVFGDYMSYLMTCTASFIRDTHPNISEQTFQLMVDKAEFVIAHPNGWEGAQQARLRKAAVLGGLVPDTAPGRARVVFVSEGEASLHYCIGEGLVGDERKGFLIADLGGGTLDFSAYEVSSTNPLRVEEMAAAKCDLEGSSFVTLRAKGFLNKKLENSRYGVEEHINLISTRFDETAKRTFRSKEELCLIQFGSIADQDPAYGIRRGSLRLTGQEVADFFEPSISATVRAVRAQKAEPKRPITAVYLVGGFSASPYLISTLKERLAPDGLTVSIPDSQTAKAVADGAISYFLNGLVTSRVAKVTYGAPAGVPYNAFNPDHLRRTPFHRHLPSGRIVVNGGFEVVLERGTTVSEETEFRRPFFDETTNWETLNNLSLDVIAYTGEGKPPKWIDEVSDRNLFKRVFKVHADTSTLQHLLQYQRARDGTMYWRYDFALVIKFGAPEMKAQLVWVENGLEKRSPAQIVYEEEYVGADEVELDDDDNGEDADLDERMDNTPAPDMGSNTDRSTRSRRDDDLANRMDRMVMNNDEAQRSPIEQRAASPSGRRSSRERERYFGGDEKNSAKCESAGSRTSTDDTDGPRAGPSGARVTHLPQIQAQGSALPPVRMPNPSHNNMRALPSAPPRASLSDSDSNSRAESGGGDGGDAVDQLLMDDSEAPADTEQLPCYHDAEQDALRSLSAQEEGNGQSADGEVETHAEAEEAAPPAYARRSFAASSATASGSHSGMDEKRLPPPP